MASVHHLFIQTALLARDAIYAHYSILPLNVTMNLESITYYMLLYTGNVRKSEWIGEACHPQLFLYTYSERGSLLTVFQHDYVFFYFLFNQNFVNTCFSFSARFLH